MIELIYGNNFYDDQTVKNYSDICNEQDFLESSYGHELSLFVNKPLIPNNLADIVSEYLGKKYILVKKESGVFRKPYNFSIHYENTSSLDDWSLIVALEKSTFNLMVHKSGAESGLETTNLNFNNFIDWDYRANILLKPKEALFYRPWMFHSIGEGLVQYFKFTRV